MKYFDNGRDRGVFRRIAEGRREWYDAKVESYAKLAFSSPSEYDEAQYFEYVSGQRNLVQYLESLDEEDRSEGSLVVVNRSVDSVVELSGAELLLVCQMYDTGYTSMTVEERWRIEEEAKLWYQVFGQLRG
jgi:hypothetical protein